MKTGISLVTMGAGNVIVLRETLESFKNICDEIIYGDLLLFPEDREIVGIYEKEYNMKVVRYPFDYIFKNGFAAILNDLSSYATNNHILYMNTSEIVDEDYGVVDIVNQNPDCNTFFFTHRSDPHRWFRLNDKRELKWSGFIHEQTGSPNTRPYHKPVFMMADLEKDLGNPFKTKVFNSVKEAVYFHQYNRIVDYPELLGETDPGWVKFAEANYESMAYRLRQKGDIYKAFLKGDYEMLMTAIYTSPDFSAEKFESNIGIEYQGDKKFLL